MLKRLNIYFVLICIMALIMSLHSRFVPILIIFVTIVSFFQFTNWKKYFTNFSVLLFTFFYLLFGVGYFYSGNSGLALFDLQIKLSIFVLPIALLPIVNFSNFPFRRVAGAFVLGTIVAIIIDLLFASWNYFHEQYLISCNLYNLNYGINYFLSSRFSFFQHPSYFSMYLNFAFVIVLFFDNIFKYKTKILFIVLLIIGIILCASKAGLICLVIILIYFIIITSKYKLAFYALIISITFASLLFIYAPEFKNKFIGLSKAITENVNEGTTESSESRVLIWHSALDLIREKPIFGYGTGDVNDELNKYYLKNGYYGLASKKLNAHNQFLQTFLAIGIIGFLCLSSILIIAIRMGIKSKNHILILLTVILIVNFLFESMLETQAGVVFFAFWLSLSFQYNKKSFAV